MDDTSVFQPDIEMDGAVGVQHRAVCPNCGRPETQWSENGGEGYLLDDQAYCCRGCADETGCTCA